MKNKIFFVVCKNEESAEERKTLEEKLNSKSL